MLTEAEITTWQATLAQWRRTRDVGELAEGLAGMSTAERSQVWEMIGEAEGSPIRRDVENLLRQMNGRAVGVSGGV